MQQASDLHDAALGALLGACIGDAAGAVLEFIMRKPSEEDVERALTMPGGGVLRVAPGQITDDGELTLCLARALAQSPSFDIEAIARQYHLWVESSPFDIGLTTRRSLGIQVNEGDLIGKGYAQLMTSSAARNNMGSKANGSLMRATPLGIWGHRCQDEKLAGYAFADSALSHPNPSCQGAVASYVIAIAHLLREPGDRMGAFERTKKWASDHTNSEVRGWLSDAEKGNDVPAEPHIGFVKIAFTYAFQELLSGADYLAAIRATLLKGGDTDTNACIVGGLLGAACGAESIPADIREAVLHCDTEDSAHTRPEFLQADQIPALAQSLISARGIEE